MKNTISLQNVILISAYSSQMRLFLPSVTTTCDRTSISDRSVAIIASFVLQDMNLVPYKNTSNVIDRSKIRRERRKARLEFQTAASNSKIEIQGLYFDGNKDKTMILERKRKQLYWFIRTEDHIVLLTEPGSTYVGHTTPSSGTRNNITKSITDFLTDNDKTKFDTLKLIVVRCDGTNINTGHNN